MAAEIVGVDKIVAYMRRFDFQKIKLSKSNNPVYLRRAKEGETQNDLINDFQEWTSEFIDENNFRDYTLELFGTYSDKPDAKLSPVVKTTVAFTQRAVAPVDYGTRVSGHNPTPIDVDKYVAVATENATLKAQLLRLEEKLDEMLEEDEDEDENTTVGEPQTVGQALQSALIGKLDTIVDIVLTRLAVPMVANTPAINGVDDTLNEFRAIHPDIDADLTRLLTLAKTQPDFFKMLIQQLRKMVS